MLLADVSGTDLLIVVALVLFIICAIVFIVRGR